MRPHPMDLLIDQSDFATAEEAEPDPDEDDALDQLVNGGLGAFVYGADDPRAAEALQSGHQPQQRGPQEFVCQACFLVKPRGQLGDPLGQRCIDCVDEGGSPP